MLCVLVVEDEPRQRKILSNIVREFRRDYEVLEAKNGEEALALCLERKIDIIFSDIRMPKMDGLSMIEYVNKWKNPAKIVVISGYNDFTYAQRAMDFHVFSYILKPIEEKKIWGLILQIEDELQKEKKSKEEKDFMTKQLNRLLPFYFEHLMNKWVRGECMQPEMDEIEGIFPFHGTGCMLLTHLAQQNFENNAAQYSTEDINEIKLNLKMWMKEVLNPYGHSISFFLEQDSCIMVSILNSSIKLDHLSNMLKDLQSLNQNLLKEYCITMSTGVGQVYDDIFSSVQESFASARAALHCLFYMGAVRIVFYPEIQHIYTREVKSSFTTEEELKQFIHGQKPLNNLWLDKGLESLIGDSYLEPETLMDYVCRLMLGLLHSIQSIIPEEKFSELFQQIKREFQFVNSLSLSALKQHWVDLLVKMAEAVQFQKDNKNNIVMERCLHYIHSNFGSELSLEELASKYYFNPSYFSTLFKKYTGMHFTDYITDLRLRNAHKLLLDSDRKIYIVAQEVGYRDVKYFNKIFKKRYGLTPDECRVFSKGR